MKPHNLTNYHSHTLFCDGRAWMEDYVKFAISQGFSSFGFSSHAPLPYPTNWTMEWDNMDLYLAEFNRLKEKYRDQIELYVGLEIDYLTESSHPALPRFQDLPLDYRIGSVHTLIDGDGNIVDIDTSVQHFAAIVRQRFDRNLKRMVIQYYDRLTRMVELGGFDILGHGDKMHYNAQCYERGLLDEPWYQKLVQEYWETVASKGCIVEINTKSYHDTGTFFPNQRYWSRLKDLGIRVQVNSDAHYPHLINNNRPEALRGLWQAGYRTVMELHQGQWCEMPIVL